MTQTILSYGLTKPFPYRSWFVYLVALGSVVATALFSVLNVAANGYELVTEHVTDVNSTENLISPAWYQKRPWSFASRVGISCQDQVFEIGSQFYTNNTNLKYEISSLATMDQTGSVPTMSFSYRNDVFRDCLLQELIMERLTGQKYEFLQARINCTTYDSVTHMPVFMSMIYTYTADPSNFGPFKNYLLNHRSPDTKAAFWWGALLLYQASRDGCLPLALSTDMFVNFSDTTFASEFYSENECNNNVHPKDTSAFISKTFWDGNDTLVPEAVNEWRSAYGNDTLNFYYCFVPHRDYCNEADGTDPARLVTLFWDMTAKIFYSFVLTDLGQSVDSNILGDGSSFVAFLNASKNSISRDDLRNGNCSLAAYTDTNNTRSVGDYPFDDPDPSKFYEWYGSALPTVYPAVINTQYLCQIPRRKPIGTIVINTIVADLVFLQTIWTILSFIVMFFVERQDPQANYCLGCTRAMEDDRFTEEKIVAKHAPPNLLGQRNQSDEYALTTPTGNPVIRRRPVGSSLHTSTASNHDFQTLSLLSGAEI